jgi:hypothetical protein
MRGMGHYLRDLRRRTAEIIPATISEIIGSGVYRVTLDRTGGTARATVAQPGVTFKVGQAVRVNRIDSSGAAPNGGLVIMGPAFLANRSDAPSYSTTTTRTAETVSRIMSGGETVERVTLTAGGAAVTVLIYGSGLTSAPTYGHAGITDDVAQVITSSLITIVVEAAGGTPDGLYSLTVAGMEIPNFFSVV